MTEKMKIYTYPDPVLRAKTEPVENIDEEIQKLVDRMAEIMYAAPGIGLAANQLGELKRVLVYDVSPRDAGRNLSVIINPEIVFAEGDIIQEEACLSVIDFSAEVSRKAKIKVRGVDRHGNPVDIEGEDLLARCLQHEIDHLNGVLFIDHISSLKRALYNKKLKKMLKKAKFPNNR
ncbi:MAG: peptide deformylase [Deltaproteobacteria bacterium]|nr:MAG: peptide deformylase [Deltaproteobacteria bacterium]